MFKLFETKSIIAYLIFILIIILLGSKLYYSEVFPLANTNSIFIGSVLNINTWNTLTLKLIVFIMISLNFILFSTICRHFSYHSKGGLVFLFILGVHTILTLTFPVNLEHIFVGFLFLVLSQILSQIYQRRETVNVFFNLGFVFSWSFFASSSMLFFLPPLLFSLMIFGKNGARDLWALLIGIGAAFAILVSLILVFSSNDLWINIFSSVQVLHYKLPYRWEWLFFVIAVLSALVAFPHINLFTINTRKFYIYLFISFLSIVLFFLIFSDNGLKNYYLIMIIASFYFTPFLFKMKSVRFKSLLVFLGLLIAILATFVQFK